MKALANNLQRRGGGQPGTCPRFPCQVGDPAQHRAPPGLLVPLPVATGQCGRCRSGRDPESTRGSHWERGGRRRPGKEHGKMLDAQWGHPLQDGGGVRAPGCAGRCAPHPSVPLPGHHWGVGDCRQVPASPSPTASAGEVTGPTSLAMASIRASLVCATGKEGTGDRPRHCAILSHPPAALLPGGAGRGVGLT